MAATAIGSSGITGNSGIRRRRRNPLGRTKTSLVYRCSFLEPGARLLYGSRMPPSRFAFEVSAENFPRLVLENSDKGPVLVYYWSPRAAPCGMLTPRLMRLADDYGGRFLLVLLNTDELYALARGHGVASIPTVKVFRHGRAVDTLHGAESEPALRRFIDKHVRAPEVAPVGALDAFRRGDAQTALRLAARAALDNPDDLRIPVDLAKMMLAQHRYHQAFDLLNALPPEAKARADVSDLLAHAEFLATAQDAGPRAAVARTPDDLAARYRLSALALTENDFDTALAQLVEIARRDASFRGGAAARGLDALFRLLGDEHPLVARYREALGS